MNSIKEYDEQISKLTKERYKLFYENRLNNFLNWVKGKEASLVFTSSGNFDRLEFDYTDGEFSCAVHINNNLSLRIGEEKSIVVAEAPLDLDSIIKFIKANNITINMQSVDTQIRTLESKLKFLQDLKCTLS